MFFSARFLCYYRTYSGFDCVYSIKLYIPGYGDLNNTKELRELKIRTDSLEQEMMYRDQYFQSLRNVLQGSSSVKVDTTALKIPKPEKIDD